MVGIWRVFLLVAALLVLGGPVFGQQVTREQIKGLDEQVQEIKSDVLDIAAELSRLEEELLYPSDTQVAVFISLDADHPFRLDSVDVRIDGRPAAQHLYTFKELEALQQGGVQRIYTGNLRTGGHEVQISIVGKTPNGAAVEQTERFRIDKTVGPKIVELRLAPHVITLKDW